MPREISVPRASDHPHRLLRTNLSNLVESYVMALSIDENCCDEDGFYHEAVCCARVQLDVTHTHSKKEGNR